MYSWALLHHYSLLSHCYYVIITHHYISCSYILLQNHYCILLHHYYIILRHNYIIIINGKNVRMIPLLCIMQLLGLSYCIIVIYYYVIITQRSISLFTQPAPQGRPSRFSSHRKGFDCCRLSSSAIRRCSWPHLPANRLRRICRAQRGSAHGLAAV